MRNLNVLLLVLILGTGLFLTPLATAQDPAALLQALEQVLNPDNYRMVMNMTTQRPGKADTAFTLEILHNAGVGSRMEILQPARSAGIRFLQLGEELWLYNPRAGGSRAIRLSSQEAFQGSLFSNEDISTPDYQSDYRAQLAGTELLQHPDFGTIEVRRLQALARSDSSAYSRIDFLLTLPDNMPLRIEYYARSGLLFKTMTLGWFTELAGRIRPRIYRMESLAEPGAVTTVSIEKLEERDNPADLFDPAKLTR
ncbi:MAG: outer membrane lipoprotein-sorting protein [Spirochaetes bacterium]|nr:outer membrane lipoprotein-sorting protein [Spirochaetota bacterium]